jgi:hypothetical protein
VALVVDSRSCPGTAARRRETCMSPTLYVRLGGIDAIRAVVDDLA